MFGVRGWLTASKGTDEVEEPHFTSCIEGHDLGYGLPAIICRDVVGIAEAFWLEEIDLYFGPYGIVFFHFFSPFNPNFTAKISLLIVLET